MRRRVVVTGIGTVCGAGADSPSFLTALREGRAGFSAIDDPRLAHLKATHHALVKEGVAPLEGPAVVHDMDRIVHLALKASREALETARVDEALGERGAVVLGTCSGGMRSIERHFEALSRGEDILDERLLFSKRYYTPAKVVAAFVGARGTVKTVVTACAAGAGAIGEAALLIRSGRADVALAGGADTFAPSTLLGFDALKATCDGICTPFSTNIGLNLGEGAGMLYLEELERALHRGATILAEILGSGSSNDAYHPTSPDPSSKAQVAALERTLSDAGLTATEIAYINAHGTGTRANDAVESKTLAKVLGDHASNVAVSSTKSLIGHCLGAAGALETAATILSLRGGFLPPTVGFDTAREGCHLDYVPDIGRPATGRIALSNSFGFGGNNACLLIDTAPNEEACVGVPPMPPPVRAVVTGLGLVHPLGLGTVPLVDDDSTGVGLLASRFDGESGEAGLVPEIDVRLVDRRLDLRGVWPLATYAVVATRMALESGGVRLRPSNTQDIGIYMGLSSGDTAAETSHLTATFVNDFKLDRVESFPFVVQNAAAGQVARTLMLKGPSTVLSTGWGAGLSVLASAALAVETGQAETVAAIGCDLITSRTIADGRAVGIIGAEPLLTPGEGAACLLVEHPDTAAARGISPRAEILGFAERTDSTDPIRATGQAPKSALAAAIAEAGVDPMAVSDVALCLGGHPVHGYEADAAAALLPNAGRYSLYPRLGFSEAALPLFNIAALMTAKPPGTLLAAVTCSEEGLAVAMILRILPVK